MTKSNQSSLDIADHLSRGEYDWCPEAETRLREQHDKLRLQQAEIEALKELNTMLKDAIEKRIGMDAERYKWLRAEFAAGRETYLAEGIPSGESLDKYIDGKLK